MNSTMTISKRFILTAGVLMLLSLTLAVVAMVGFNGASKGVHFMSASTIPGLVYGTAMSHDVSEMQSMQLRHIISRSPDEMQQIEQERAAMRDQLNHDKKSYEDYISEGEDRQNFDRLKPMMEASDRAWQKMLPLSRSGDQAGAIQVYANDVRPSTMTLTDQLDTMVEWNKKAIGETVNTTTGAVHSAWWLTMITGIVCLATGIAIAWLMIRTLNRQMSQAVSELTEGAEQISSAASQVSSSSQSLAQGSSEQAASIEETSASSEEINSMARKNTDNSRSMASLMGRSQEMFTRTNRQLEEMVISMDEINESSGKISKIIKVIDEIAFQTNILALNAAVEAARAGEAGMGFAVVADEVRNLAQRSAQAAKDTALLIEESISKSNAGKEKVDQVATAIREITSDSVKIKTLVDEVSLGSEEQSRGLDQIARAITQMEQVTQTAAANAEESAAAAEELNAQSEALRDVVGRLNSMVGGHAESFNTRRPGAVRSHAGASKPVAHTAIRTTATAAFSSPKLAEDKKSFPLETAFHEF
jgi:methyl-accepting chemotaxis protein